MSNKLQNPIEVKILDDGDYFVLVESEAGEIAYLGPWLFEQGWAERKSNGDNADTILIDDIILKKAIELTTVI